MRTRTITQWVASGAFAAAMFASIGAQAQDYPVRPIQVIVPFAGGSASDVVTRIMLDRMAKTLGQPFIVDNRPGAGGNTGTLAAVRTAPDGYTLVMSTVGPLAANRTLFKSLGYDPEKDFTPISLFAVLPNVIVINSKLPPKTLTEFVAYAKQHPKELNYGSVGVGSSQHLAGAYFDQIAGVELVHVPYRNIAQYGPDLMSGAVPLGFQWYPNVSGPLGAKGAKALAVAGANRLDAVPEAPTTKEAGLPEYQVSGWFALLAPKGTPAAIVTKLNTEMKAALSDADVRAKFQIQGAEPIWLSPEQAKKFIADEIVKYRDIIIKAGIPPIE